MLLATWIKMIIEFQVLMWDRLSDKNRASNSSSSTASEDRKVRGDPSSVLTYFPFVNNDASKVSWAHRVNNRQLLKQSLADENILMLEADVLRGRLKNSADTSEVAIMAHPPDRESDLTFDDFIDNVIQAKAGKGVKLDFKDFSVVEECLKKLQKRSDELKFPILLNADIIAGPLKAKKTPIDADAFLSTCKTYFPEATLSVGWTIDVPKLYLGGGAYRMDHLDQMLAALERNNITQPVTFPVFGLFAHNSVKALGWLLDRVAGSSLTIWGGKMDAPYHNRKALARMRDELGRDRVFFDLPYNLPK
ncbi:unnamed protein product [Notodromas monacha]|uniref:Menorin-like domain-containing protein n=1 Tax=Notodromas monacha TaxID=399045 RepID=A0A7R9BTS1_9CRUS|nr:unnamed protein product [Notodromas monacha]CAG0920212.1 unnamed protein product [Notodromas monacha]